MLVAPPLVLTARGVVGAWRSVDLEQVKARFSKKRATLTVRAPVVG